MSNKALLTIREKQILELVAEGLEYAEIADRVGLAVCSVKQHVKFALARLHATNRTHAVVLAMRLGEIRR